MICEWQDANLIEACRVEKLMHVQYIFELDVKDWPSWKLSLSRASRNLFSLIFRCEGSSTARFAVARCARFSTILQRGAVRGCEWGVCVRGVWGVCEGCVRGMWGVCDGCVRGVWEVVEWCVRGVWGVCIGSSTAHLPVACCARFSTIQNKWKCLDWS